MSFSYCDELGVREETGWLEVLYVYLRDPWRAMLFSCRPFLQWFWRTRCSVLSSPVSILMWTDLTQEETELELGSTNRCPSWSKCFIRAPRAPETYFCINQSLIIWTLTTCYLKLWPDPNNTFAFSILSLLPSSPPHQIRFRCEGNLQGISFHLPLPGAPGLQISPLNDISLGSSPWGPCLD